MQTIYIDILFAVNFSMDFLAIYITSYLLKLKLKTKKAILAALFGALYSVVTVAFNLSGILFALLFALFMCHVAFGRKRIKESLYIFIAFIAVNFLIGGGMTAVFSLFNAVVGERLVMIYGDINKVPERLPLNIFAVGVTAITFFIMIFGKIFSKKGVARSIKTVIFLSGKSASFTLIEDSGNLLTEHMSGEPVIFLSESAMLKITDEKTLEGIKSFDSDIMKKSGFKMRLTVYETVSGRDTGICIRPEKTIVENEEVLCWITLGKGDIFGENDGIIPSALVKM